MSKPIEDLACHLYTEYRTACHHERGPTGTPTLVYHQLPPHHKNVWRRLAWSLAPLLNTEPNHHTTHDHLRATLYQPSPN